MALDLDRLKASAQNFAAAKPESQAHYLNCSQIALSQLAEDLPALSETDRAAVAYYIAQVLASMRTLSMANVSDVLLDTAVGYSLGACRLVGMIP